MAFRIFSVSLIAASITFGLFWVMQALVGTEGELIDAKATSIVDFVRLKRDSQPETKKREIPDRTPPKAPPPPPQMDFSQNLNPDAAVTAVVPIVDATFEMIAAEIGGGGSDRDVVPMVRVEPQYPMSAKQKRIEGWVELMYTITKVGTVKDIVVTAASAGTIFNRAAIQAVSKWKYNPKIENGVAVERPRVRQRIKFKLPW